MLNRSPRVLQTQTFQLKNPHNQAKSLKLYKKNTENSLFFFLFRKDHTEIEDFGFTTLKFLQSFRFSTKKSVFQKD